MKEVDLNYIVTIKYVKNESDPVSIFNGAAKMIESIRNFDSVIINSIGKEVDTEQVLESVTESSVRTAIKQKLFIEDDQELGESANDENIKKYVEKSREIAFSRSNEDISILKPESYNQIAKEIEAVAEEEKIYNSITYKAVSPLSVAENINEIRKAVNSFNENENVIYETDEYKEEIKKAESGKLIDIKKELSFKELTNESEVIWKVKKPDLLGNSKWQFKEGKKNISAAIEDTDWLEKFHDKDISLSSGVAIQAKVSSTVYYDENGNVLNEEHVITKVIDIL